MTALVNATSNVPARAFALASVFALASCTGRIVVKEDANAGLPFHQNMVVREYFVLAKHTTAPECAPVRDYRYTSIPSGEVRYLNVEGDAFASISLNVKYTDTGTLQEVSFNSEPSSEAITAVSEALVDLLPFVGALPSERKAVETADARTGVGATRLPCNTGRVDERFEKVSAP
jgi:hypothetical protein